MEKVNWNGKVYIALEISKDPKLEEEIRDAGRNNQLCCLDPDCPRRIAHYRRGESKRAHFAHFEESDCDYSRFDEENKDVKDAQYALYNHFKSKGFDIRLEEKLLKRHYVNLVLYLSDDQKIAIELGTQRKISKRIERFSEQYKREGIKVQWIVINDDITDENNKTDIPKKYLPNLGQQKSVLIINSDGTKITQFVEDPNQYLIGGQLIHSENYPDFYKESEDLSRLTFEDGEITIAGFYQRYEEWLAKKQRAFNVKKEREEKAANGIRNSEPLVASKAKRKKSIASDIYDNDAIRQELLASNEPVFRGAVQYKLCLHCNKVKDAQDCDYYTRYENPNWSCCHQCKENDKPRKY